MGPSFVEPLPVAKFHDVGSATAAKFNAFGIWTGLDIRNQSLAFLQETSANPAPTTTGSRAVSTTARSVPTESANPSAPKTRLSPT